LLQLKQLTLLNLNHTQITDAGLAQIVSLPNLRNLHVAGTRVTGEGVRKAQERVDGSLRIYTLDFEASRPHSVAGDMR
jgi:hypothetical protein